MKYAIIILAATFSYSCWAQDLRMEIQQIVIDLAESNSIESKFIGYRGVKSKQFEKIQTLDSLATNAEIQFLIKHNAPVVRCAAYSALCTRKIIDAQKYLRKAIYDKERINTQIGCIGRSRKVADIFLESFLFSLAEIDSTEWATIRPEMLRLDSLILNDPQVKLDYKSSRVRGLKPTRSNYNLVRGLAETKSQSFAVITLAKYKKEQDIPILIDWLEDKNKQYYGIWAAREFPDPTFYPYLIKIFKKKWRRKYYSYSTWRVLYQALAQYPDNIETIELFDKTIEAKNRFRKETLGKYLLMAVTKYPNSKFEEYKNKIKLTGLHAEFLDEEMAVEN